MKLDIGVLSYRAPEKLSRTLRDIQAHSTSDWRCFIIHNPSEGDEQARAVIESAVSSNNRFRLVDMPENIGYAGGVNKLLTIAETEYIAYFDNDVRIHTPGWDMALAGYLDRFHEIGMVFPNGGPYPVQRDAYTEVMWGVGFAWMLSRMAQRGIAEYEGSAGLFDTAIGHQEEADWALRVRMAGWRLVCVPSVQVEHDATATNNPASQERINAGVVRWVTKWNRYFNGARFDYHSPNVTRVADWPPNALYLEDFWKQQLPGLNAEPEQVDTVVGRHDLIKVPRLSGFYRGRVI